MPESRTPSLLTLPRDIWRLAKPYFTSEERVTAWTLLTAIVVLNLSLVGLDVVLNYWNGAFFNSLQNKDQDAFIGLLMTYNRSEENGLLPGFVSIAVVYIVVAVYRAYLNQWLQISWRKWMTAHLLDDWLADRAYYRISLTSGTNPDQGTDNPDQRIAEDIRGFVTSSLSIGLDLLSNIVTLFSFIFILWRLSGTTVILGIAIPGFMVWAALGYAVIGTLLTHLVGKPLIRLNFNRQKVEADFRFSLGRLRENLEGVALYRGEAQERAGLRTQFDAIALNWWAIMRRTKALNALIAGYGQVSGIFPIVVAAPRFFAGTLNLGGLTRTAGAFGSVQSAMSFFINSYTSLAELRATIDRLLFFNTAIAEARKSGLEGIKIDPLQGHDYRLQNVTLKLPDGRVLLEHIDLDLPQGRSTVFTGRSGSGKSTLFRAFSGIWPFGTGQLSRGAGETLFLPQRPYFPLGTLREAVNYPGRSTHASDADLLQALQDVLRVLRERLPQTTIISIAHRKEVAALHEMRFEISRSDGQSGHIAEAPNAARLIISSLLLAATTGCAMLGMQDRTATSSASPAPSAEIRQTQLVLQQQGTYNGRVDGVAGPATVESIRLYQQSHKLQATGTLDDATRNSLRLNENPVVEKPHTAMADGSRMSATEARKLIESQGFTAVSGLYQDDSAVWRGTANMNGKTSEVAIDAKGKVVMN
eukprot:gene6018-6091_t